MKTQSTSLAIGLLSFLLIAAPKCVRADEGDQEELKDKALAGLTDLTILRDDVKRRFALFTVGVRDKVYANDKAPLTIPMYRLLAEDSESGFKYFATGHVTDRGIKGQYWGEFVQEKSRVKTRKGMAYGPGYEIKKGATPGRLALESGLPFLEPFDDLVLHAGYLKSPSPNEGWIESLFIDQSEIIECEETTGGDLRSHWKWDKGQMHFDIELTQSKKLGFLPTEVKYKSRIKHFPNMFSHVRIEWKFNRKIDNYLPYRLEAVEGSKTGLGTDQHTMIFDWKIGDEVGDELFDWSLEDNRIPFSKYYDFQFDVAVNKRIVPGTPWEAPEGLFPESKKTK